MDVTLPLFFAPPLLAVPVATTSPQDRTPSPRATGKSPPGEPSSSVAAHASASLGGSASVAADPQDPPLRRLPPDCDRPPPSPSVSAPQQARTVAHVPPPVCIASTRLATTRATTARVTAAPASIPSHVAQACHDNCPGQPPHACEPEACDTRSMPAPTHMALMRVRTTSLSGARSQPFGLSVHANLQRLQALSSDPTDVRAQGGAMSASTLRLAARELCTVYCSAHADILTGNTKE
ncbi:hypothetical protein K438DRAFT_1977037 [Mycena galopus ATCC 62051]|nr:hypothetical protein K438DRAFT_1977037 [Mycena galopus ATCC 62051]